MRHRILPLVILLAALLPLAAGSAFAAPNADMEKIISSTLVDKLGDDAKPIRVAFFDGKAVLSGQVNEKSTKELAKEVALYVPGVTKVENEIEPVKGRVFGGGKLIDESADTSLESGVKDALHREIGTYSSDVEIEACEGVVSIRGNVPDKTRHDLAVAAATKVNGVKKLVDLLRFPG